MIGSILGLWEIQSLDPGAQGLPLVAWVSNWMGHWLATPIISVSLLAQYILQVGQIVGPRLYD